MSCIAYTTAEHPCDNASNTQKKINKRPMGLVTLLVVLNHLPYNIKLSFMPKSHGADKKYMYLIVLKVQDLYPPISLHNQPFSIYFRYMLLHLLPC